MKLEKLERVGQILETTISMFLWIVVMVVFSHLLAKSVVGFTLR